jgi:hypothetical protein
MGKLVPMLAVALAFSLAIPASSSPAQAPKPGAELDERGLWVGDWTLAGTAKDTPTGPEYGLVWHLHGRRILGGFFVQIDQVWQGKGPEQHALEILSYDTINKIYRSSGFQSDGTAWVATATFDGRTYVENGTTRAADGSAAKWRCTWTFSADKMAVSATQESEQHGARWTSLAVKGTKSPGKTQ